MAIPSCQEKCIWEFYGLAWLSQYLHRILGHSDCINSPNKSMAQADYNGKAVAFWILVLMQKSSSRFLSVLSGDKGSYFKMTQLFPSQMDQVSLPCLIHQGKNNLPELVKTIFLTRRYFFNQLMKKS